ncbi:hypothetical protein SAMN04487975_101593 [Planococcus glaciei]|uniref:hypothetical protein n=1 Tax=Planococcus glaciei TaxID=459472 RepID=UPI00087E78D8|nr:hypothetical protein [Planococcus glaciei]SDG82737.1 hypothetical protein SAMN04487975_101593 [Planococcus glaciei]
MASIMYAVECPQCGRSAFADNYYKIDVTYIHCRRCGYNAVTSRNPEEARRYGHDVHENPGYGVCLSIAKEGHLEMTMFNCFPVDVEQCKAEILATDPELKKSFLVTYTEGVFEIILGTPSENFHLPFKEYAEKMYEKHGDIEGFEGLVPIEN